MEKLIYKYERLVKSYNALSRSLKLYTDDYETANLAQKEAYSTSLVKHFEMCYEMLWKYLKYYLMLKYGTDTIGSKNILRAAYTHKVISEEELVILLKIIEERNETAHVYDEDTACALCDKINNYFPVFEKIINKING